MCLLDYYAHWFDETPESVCRDAVADASLISGAFAEVMKQCSALKVMGNCNTFEYQQPCLPVHIAATLRLAVLLSVATKQS